MSDLVVTPEPLRSKAEEAAIDCAKKATPPLNSNGCYQARDYVMFMAGVNWLYEQALDCNFEGEVSLSDLSYYLGKEF